MSENALGNTIKETVVTCVKAFRLQSISTRHFIEFKCLRELFERELAEKEMHLKETIIATTHWASIDKKNVKFFNAAGWIECLSVDELTEQQIISCVQE